MQLTPVTGTPASMPERMIPICSLDEQIVGRIDSGIFSSLHWRVTKILSSTQEYLKIDLSH